MTSRSVTQRTHRAYEMTIDLGERFIVSRILIPQSYPNSPPSAIRRPSSLACRLSPVACRLAIGDPHGPERLGSLATFTLSVADRSFDPRGPVAVSRP